VNVPHEGYIYPGAVHGCNCDATPERHNKAAADWFNRYVRAWSSEKVLYSRKCSRKRLLHSEESAVNKPVEYAFGG
jgi:hypothetical protein